MELTNIDTSNFFNPENFTRENNPVLAAVYYSLSASTDWSDSSESIISLEAQHSAQKAEFYKSLTESQSKLYAKFEEAASGENALNELECFIKGFRLAAALISGNKTIEVRSASK